MNGIYNEKVASYKKEVQKQEAAIIEGKQIVQDLNDFMSLYEEVEQYITEYQDLVNNGKEQYRRKLNEYLKEELDYLELIVNLLNTLANYHANNSDIEMDEISAEWSDVRILVTVENIRKALKRAEALKDRYPQEKYNELTKRYKSLLDKALVAENNLLRRAEGTVNEKIIGSENNKCLVIEDVLKEFTSVYDKISYIEHILENIESIAGKKRTILVNGVRKNIVIKYASRYLSYVGKLNNLYLERDKEEDELVALSKNIEAQLEKAIDIPCIDKYWEIKDELHEYQNQLAILISRVTNTTNEEAINVTLYNGNSARILKEDLPKFEEIEAKINDRFSQIETLMSEYGMDVNNEELTDDEKKQEIFEKINFLKQTGISGEALDNQIKELIKEYAKVEKRKRFTSVAGLTRLFRKQGFDKEQAMYLAEISYDPQKLVKNKEVTDEKKQNIFKELWEDFKGAMLLIDEDLDEIFYEEEPEIEENEELSQKSKLEILKEKAHGVKEKLQSSSTKIKVSSFAEKAKKTLESLPKKVGNYVSKIKNLRKPVNKKAIKESVKKHSLEIGAVLGMGVVLSVTATSNYQADSLNNVSKIEESTHNDRNLNAGVIDTLGENLEIKKDRAIFDSLLADTTNNENDITVADMVSEMSEKINNKTENIEISKDSYQYVGSGITNAISDSLTNESKETLNSGVISSFENNLEKQAEILGDQVFTMSNQQESINIDIGDTFTVNDDKEIYENEYDAINEINALKSYYGADTEREITGIAYNYNGAIVLLKEDDPDFEAKKAALESNGAKPQAVRSQVGESGVSEGFWNIDDINEKGRLR